MQLLIFASFSEPHLGGKVQSDPQPTPSFLGCFSAAIPTASDFAILVLHLIEVNNLSLFRNSSSPYRGSADGWRDGRGGHCTLLTLCALALSASSRRRVGRSPCPPPVRPFPPSPCAGQARGRPGPAFDRLANNRFTVSRGESDKK